MNIAKLKIKINDLIRNVNQYKNTLSRIPTSKEKDVIFEKQLELDFLKFIQNLKNEIKNLEEEFTKK